MGTPPPGGQQGWPPQPGQEGWQGPAQPGWQQPAQPGYWQPPYPGQPYGGQPYWQPTYGFGGPPPWARPPIDPSRLRPKLAWLALAALPFLLGLGLMAPLIVDAVHTFPKTPRTFVAPATVTVHVDAGKEETIFAQTEGTAFATSDTPGCSVRDALSGTSVPLHEATNTNETVSRNTDRFEPRLEFTAPATSDYRVRCESSAGPGTSAALGVGPKPHIGRFIGRVFGAIGALLAGMMLAALVVVVVLVRRGSHRRRLQDEAMAAQAAGGA